MDNLGWYLIHQHQLLVRDHDFSEVHSKPLISTLTEEMRKRKRGGTAKEREKGRDGDR